MFQEMHKLSAKLPSGSWLPDLSCPGPEIREGGSQPDGDGEKQKLSSGSYLPALAPGLPGHTSPPDVCQLGVVASARRPPKVGCLT